MSFFKAAMIELDHQQISIIWVDEKFLGKDDEIQKQLSFFKGLIDCPNIAIMILDDNEKPNYYGEKHVIQILKFHDWKRFPWASYKLDKN
jgi:hypothetical protein